MIKDRRLTTGMLSILRDLRKIGVSGTLGVGVKSVDIQRNTNGEGSLLGLF